MLDHTCTGKLSTHVICVRVFRPGPSHNADSKGPSPNKDRFRISLETFLERSDHSLTIERDEDTAFGCLWEISSSCLIQFLHHELFYEIADWHHTSWEVSSKASNFRSTRKENFWCRCFQTGGKVITTVPYNLKSEMDRRKSHSMGCCSINA